VAEGSFNVVKIWTGMIRPPLMVSPSGIFATQCDC
jgi:hypothetical protein